MLRPSPAEKLQRHKTLNDAFDSGILICFQHNKGCMKRLQEYWHMKPVPSSDQEAYTQELAWKEIEVDLAVARREAFKRTYADHKFPIDQTSPPPKKKRPLANPEPKLPRTVIEQVFAEEADEPMLKPDTPIQVLYNPGAYTSKPSATRTPSWKTVSFLYLSTETQNKAMARLERFLESRPRASVTQGQESYLRQAFKVQPLCNVQMWDHAVLLLHHWLSAWVWIYSRAKNEEDLHEAMTLLEDFREREPMVEWHWESMERYWNVGMGEEAVTEM